MEPEVKKAKTILIRVKNRNEFLDEILALVHDKGKNPHCQASQSADNSTDQSSPFSSHQQAENYNQPNIKTEVDQFSYESYLTIDEKNITFLEFMSATLKWAANAEEASADDLRGYLTHLSFITDMAATQKYDQHVHVNYDRAVRVQAEKHGWQSFKTDDRDLAVLYYGDANSARVNSQDQRGNAAFSAPLHDSFGDMIGSEQEETTSSPPVRAIVDPVKIESTYVAFQNRTISDQEIVDFLCATGEAELDNEKAKEAVTSSTPETNTPAPQDTELAATGEDEDDRDNSDPTTLSEGLSTSEMASSNLHGHNSVPKKKRGVHICSYCGKEFKGSVTSCMNHERLHTGEKPYKCTHCGNQYRTSQHLKKHAMSHTEEKHFPCSYCNKECFKPHALRDHEMIHTGEKPHLCSVCGKGFRQLSKLKSHMLHHTGEKPHHCTHCGQRFRLREFLRVHMRHHTGEEQLRHSTHTYKNLTKFKEKEPSHQCQHCDKKFSAPCQLKAHTMIHTGEKPHMCSECDKRFSQLVHLKTHMLTHTGEKPHVCPECGKGFSLPFSLRKHMLVHTGEKPHVCSDCGRGFNSLGNLTRHMITHTGEKPYICSHCGKGFSQKTALQLHVMIHTGEKPFECSECGKGFNRAVDLRKHIKVHGQKTAQKSMDENPVNEHEGYQSAEEDI